MMVLETLLNDFGKDFAYFIGSDVLDSFSTYVGIKRNYNDIFIESNIGTRNNLLKYGIGKGLTLFSLKTISVFGLVGIGMYGLDNLVGFENKNINLHHFFLYGFCTVKSLAAASNFSYTLGLKKMNKIFGFIPNLSINLINAISGKKFYD